jgi:hypothetical protein
MKLSPKLLGLVSAVSAMAVWAGWEGEAAGGHPSGVREWMSKDERKKPPVPSRPRPGPWRPELEPPPPPLPPAPVDACPGCGMG